MAPAPTQPIPTNNVGYRIGIVVGEPSGDLLAGAILQALKKRLPSVHARGIAGPRLLALGCTSLFPMSRLSVMGLVEVARHLPQLLRIRQALVRHFLADPPDLFIGVDAPDFNLGLEARLRCAGIPTIHVVSPSVWAWRTWRVKKIAASVDCMLTLFPFEAAFYEQHAVPARYIGHPRADEIPLQNDRAAARNGCGIAIDARVLAVLPGSRLSEVKRLSEPFLRACLKLLADDKSVQFVAPLATSETFEYFQRILKQLAPTLPIRVLQGQSIEAMIAADVVLLASGTATLEAMLVKRPMVVAYRVAPTSAWLMRRLIHVPYVALPNLLAGERIVPELLQEQAQSANLAQAVHDWFGMPEVAIQAWQARCAAIHKDLKRNAAEQAAAVITDMLEGQRCQAKS